MDCSRVGNLIFDLRTEKGLTQKQLADAMNISDKTESKWERGLGCPDVSLLSELSAILEVDIKRLLGGELEENTFVGGNMKKATYFVCPTCGNVVLSTGNAEVSCCGRRLSSMTPKKAEEKLNVESVENDWYISSDHSMSKEDYISFVAFATGDKVNFIKQYPEWNLQARIPKREHGMLIWYSNKDGLLYQLV